jgi:cysteine peptidase B
MRSLALLALLAVAIAHPMQEVARVRSDDKDWAPFVTFTHTYRKAYQTVPEVNMRFETFKSNMLVAAQHNIDNPLAEFGVTKFSDLSPEEFRSTHLMPINITSKLKPKNMKKWIPPTKTSTIARSDSPIDWCDSSHNLCTPVKDQGDCGSCWAFSATQTIESANAAAGNGLNVLAPEQIVDCDSSDNACGGGDPRSGMQYVQGAPGQEAESNYPYTAGQNGDPSSCSYDQSEVVETDSNGPIDVSDGDESKLISFLESTGPPSVCVDASSWQTYRSGVISKCGCQIDHAVQAVGIQIVSGVEAYKVRNSWAADWGVEGFIFLKVGSNTCCVANEVSWASV